MTPTVTTATSKRSEIESGSLLGAGDVLGRIIKPHTKLARLLQYLRLAFLRFAHTTLYLPPARSSRAAVSRWSNRRTDLIGQMARRPSTYGHD